MSDPVTVIDYGAGNLASITAGLDRLGGNPRVSDDADEIATARRLVLPGVGAAAPAMAELHRRGLVEAIGVASIAARRCWGSASACNCCSSEVTRATSSVWD